MSVTNQLLHARAELGPAADGIQAVVEIPHIADNEGSRRRWPSLRPNRWLAADLSAPTAQLQIETG